MTNREGKVGYLDGDGVRRKQGVKTPYKSIDIVLTGNVPAASGVEGDESIDIINSLPLFMRGLAPENWRFSFMINPSQMDINYQKIINYFFTRGGWVLEHVSDELPKMTLTGTTASFRDPLLYDSFKDGNTNLVTSKGRYISAGFKNLLHLIDMYRNNGRIFYVDPFFGSSTNSILPVFDYNQRIKTASPVKIIYGDEEEYEGFFMGMSVREDANAPYSMEFSLDFAVTRIYELWRIKSTNNYRTNTFIPPKPITQLPAESVSGAETIQQLSDSLDRVGKILGTSA